MDYKIPLIIPYNLLIDLDYGIIHYISKKANQELFTNIPKRSVDLIAQLINRDNINPLMEYIIDKDKADEYYNAIMNNKKELIMKLSPETGLLSMIVTSIRTSSESIKVTIACKDELEKEDILNRLLNFKCSCECIIVKDYPSNINLKLYDNLFIKDIDSLSQLPSDLKLKNILISLYRFNMEKDYASIPKLDCVTPYNKLNKILTVDIYQNIKLNQNIEGVKYE